MSSMSVSSPTRLASSSSFRWGIFGTGAISAKFVAGLRQTPGHTVSFVASRSREKAAAFASSLGIAQSIEGYEEAAASGFADAIYVATPPSEHARHTLACLNQGVPVLVEKPMATHPAEIESLIQAALSRKVFLMEAMWTRFLPAAQAFKKLLSEGQLGRVQFVSGSFGTSQLPSQDNGMFQAKLGGGALLHLGAYPLSLGQWLFGSPLRVEAIGHIGPSGVDESVSVQLAYPNDVIASFLVSLRAWAPDDFRVMGSHGMAAFRGSIVRPHGIEYSEEQPVRFAPPVLDWKERLRQSDLIHRVAQRLDRSSRARIVRENHPYRGNGYHYEADEVRRCVEAGRLESSIMPLKDSAEVARTMATIADLTRRPSTQVPTP